MQAAVPLRLLLSLCLRVLSACLSEIVHESQTAALHDGMRWEEFCFLCVVCRDGRIYI